MSWLQRSKPSAEAPGTSLPEEARRKSLGVHCRLTRRLDTYEDSGAALPRAKEGPNSAFRPKSQKLCLAGTRFEVRWQRLLNSLGTKAQ
jgi:hypothetical protein